MSNQLYGDSQTMIKNVVFCAAKQQLLDPSERFNAKDDGTDPLEVHFGFMQELGAHNSAMNYKQGIERNGWASDIHAVYARNPDLHAGHRRRKATHTEIKDHLNAESWTGDVVSGHCDLISSWRSGREEATRILATHSRFLPATYDFRTILSQSGVGFLRPFGQNKYPGVEDDYDCSLDDINPPTNQPDSTPSSAAGNIEPESITLEELVETPEPLQLQPAPGIRPGDYMADENGKLIHKASVCRLVLNKEFVAKSKNRGERAMGLNMGNVRAFTKPNGARALRSDGITGSAFVTSDLFVTLVQNAKTVSLAVLRCTDISQEGTRSMKDINVKTIGNPKANVKLTGQILCLKAVTAIPDDTKFSSHDHDPSTSDESQSTSTWTWLWSGKYLMGQSAMKGTSVLTDKPITLTVAGHLLEPINPSVADVQGRLTADESKEINSSGATWALDDVALRVLVTVLWTRIEDGKLDVGALPYIKDSFTGFPYSWSTGAYFIDNSLTIFSIQ